MMPDLIPDPKVPPTERFGRWQEIISTNFVPLAAKPLTGDGFNGELLSQDVGTMQLRGRVTRRSAP